MADFYNTVREDGLVRAQRAHDEIERDPQQLDLERQRLYESPLLHKSGRSGTLIQSTTPKAPGTEQRFQLWYERQASLPHHQFAAQTSDEESRIFGASRLDDGRALAEIARRNVKKRWVEQGIWNSKWNELAEGRWKHEEPLELESQWEVDPALAVSYSFAILLGASQFPPKRLKSDEELRHIAERRTVRAREREASHPYHQLVYQMSREQEQYHTSKEWEQFQDRSMSEGGTEAADFNTKVYENVKNTWTKRGIWNQKWGVLPGMLWKHEEPLDVGATDGPATLTNPVENGSPGVERTQFPAVNGASSRNRPGHLATNIWQSGLIWNTSPIGPSTHNSLVEMETDDHEVSPKTPNSPGLRTSKGLLRTTVGQASRPSKGRSVNREGQPPPAANAFLGPVHASKISKATDKKRPPSHRLARIAEEALLGGLPLSSENAMLGGLPLSSENTLLGGLPLSSAVHTAEVSTAPSPARVDPCGPAQMQGDTAHPPTPISSVADDLPRPVSPQLTRRATRSTSEWDIVTRNSARS